MHVIIVGAGEVGKQLARVLCFHRNDVVVVDTDEQVLAELQDRLDIMVVVGNGASARTLKQAGVDRAALLLAVSNNSEANIIACNMAKQFNVGLKIARLRAQEFFTNDRGATAADFGVDVAIIPEYECASDIMEALLRPAVREVVKFSHPEAQMVNFQIPAGSPMIGQQLRSFPEPRFLEQLRFCAIMRYGQLIIPRGGTHFLAFDEVYVAGPQSGIEELISWAEPRTKSIARVIVAGGTRLGRMVTSMLRALDIRVCLIEPDRAAAERAADLITGNPIILQGSSTELAVLEEAGIDRCDAFVAANSDNETNILSCILAKRHGAGKAIAVTNNADYVHIIAGMNTIDCCFSPLFAAINMLIKHIGRENRRSVAILNRVPAEVMELKVAEGSPAAGKRIADLKVPPEVVFALIMRDDMLVPAIGSEQFRAGDQVIVLMREELEGDVEKLFRRRKLA